MFTVDVVLDQSSTVDDLLSLRNALGSAPELRGRINLRQSKAGSGTMGPLSDALVIALEPGGAVTALSAVLIAWTRQRTAKISLTIKKEGGTELTINADRIRKAKPRDIESIGVELARELDGR